MKRNPKYKIAASNISASKLSSLPASDVGLPASQHPSITASIELPWGGGGYFRLIPWQIFKYGMKIMMHQDKAILFYMHPWEIDPAQPRVGQAKLSYRFRHYTNLNRTEKKLRGLLRGFSHCEFISCKEYIEK